VLFEFYVNKNYIRPLRTKTEFTVFMVIKSSGLTNCTQHSLSWQVR